MRFILPFLLIFSLQAKTILISDIDDTIKVGHIRSSTARILNAFRTRNIFLGMADLYHAVKLDSDATIYYLTNAPVKIMKRSHTKLIKRGNFPQGKILFRPSGVSSSDHKNIALEHLMKTEQPDTVILVGDNGEHDIKFYETIAKKYPAIDFKTFIRVAYDLDAHSTPVTGQKGFVSPFEIATSLYDDGLLEFDSTNSLFRKHAAAFVADEKNRSIGRMYLPSWMGCKNHELDQTMQNSTFIFSKFVQDKINRVCK